MNMEQKSEQLERGAGILLPISSLPSPYGIGSLGQTDDGDFACLADYVYEKVFLGYTVKQWGVG